MSEIREKYKHPLWRQAGDLARGGTEAGGTEQERLTTT